ncbi:MAG: transglutaminase domain-containing protein, partial [Paramuribaculum sp.]|nr:transglutaminase domain-containing protein [Paramuribaculum sp.]
SNHALRDIALEAAELEKSGLPVVMLFASKTDAENIDPSLLAGLPSTTTLGIDIDGTIADEIAENLRLPSSKGPIFIIADTFNRVVFVRQGYTIGLGHQLTNTIKRL